MNDQAAWDTTTNSLKIMDDFQKRGAKEEWVFGELLNERNETVGRVRKGERADWVAV